MHKTDEFLIIYQLKYFFTRAGFEPTNLLIEVQLQQFLLPGFENELFITIPESN